MQEKPLLHVLFTMDCETVATKQVKIGPKAWSTSARSMEGYSHRVLNAGHAVTLFVAPGCAEELAPLLEELDGRGAELGSYVHPPSLTGGAFKRNLGEYDEEQQLAIFEHCRDRAREALGANPRSVRTGNYSASDATFRLAYEAGYRQGSLSNPGRDIRAEAAVWAGAPTDPHYPDPNDRLRAGGLPFLEVPATTDAGRIYRRGVPYELSIEAGGVEQWHRPLAEAQLERMEREGVAFRSLCISTRNVFAYHQADSKESATLDALIAYFDELRERYELVPATFADAHDRYRKAALYSHP